jgi:hypothetical protein
MERSLFVFLRFRVIAGERKFLRPIKTQAALSATVGPDGHEKKNPEFKNPAAFGAVHMHAPTSGTSLVRVVDKKSEDTPH